MLRTSLLILALSGPAFLAQGANAQETQAETVILSTRDVDFGKPSDVQAFYGKLQKAAHLVCDIQGDSLSVRQDNQNCRDRAIDDAIENLHQPMLTSWHQEAAQTDPKQMAQATVEKPWR